MNNLFEQLKNYTNLSKTITTLKLLFKSVLIESLLARLVASSTQSIETDVVQHQQAQHSSHASIHHHHPLGIIMPCLVFGILLFTTLTIGLMQFFCKPEDQFTEPEEQFNVVLCQEDAVKFEYNFILRVGCPTANFDINHGYIDLEVYEGKDNMIGCPVRFDCSLLPDRICGEMHCLIGRVTPMPPISYIRISHGDKNGSIFLYEYILISLPEEQIMEVRRFNTYLTNKATDYKGKVVTDTVQGGEFCSFPIIPQIKWTTIELAIISSVIIMFTGSVVLIIEYYNNLYIIIADDNLQQEGSMWRTLLDVIYVSPLALLLLVVLSIPYKFFMKPKKLRAQYAIIQEQCQQWWWICTGYMTSLWLASLSMFSIFAIYGLRITFIKSLYWLCSCLIIWSCVFGTWIMVNKCEYFRKIFQNIYYCSCDTIIDNSPSTFNGGGKDDDGGYKGVGYRQYRKENKIDKLSTNRTVFFSVSKPNLMKGHRKALINGDGCKDDKLRKISAGPKLVNPLKILINLQQL